MRQSSRIALSSTSRRLLWSSRAVWKNLMGTSWFAECASLTLLSLTISANMRASCAWLALGLVLGLGLGLGLGIRDKG